jgi:3-methyladenine DNA glycosylase/8-oxoguanine DNA glycosylase
LPTETFSVPPVDLRLSLFPLRRGTGDPTTRFELDGCWRALRTPDGPATLRLRCGQGVATRIEAEAWGPGAEAALGRVPALLGAHDRPEDLVLGADDPLAELARRRPGLRFGVTGSVAEVLASTILEQKVTGLEARRAWRGLVRRHGEPAPGPGGLWVAPDPATIAALPYHALHPLGVERRRAATVVRAHRRPDRLARLDRVDAATARRVLQEIPGIGPWTAAWVTTLSHGDPDTVILGDFHLPHQVAWFFTGRRRGSDQEMLEHLAPYAGQRGRVQRLVAISASPPRRAPRLAPRRFAHM